MFLCVMYVSRYVFTPIKSEVSSGTPERLSYLVPCMCLAM